MMTKTDVKDVAETENVNTKKGKNENAAMAIFEDGNIESKRMKMKIGQNTRRRRLC